MNLAIDVSDLTKSYRLYRKPSDRLKSFFFRNIPCDVINALDNVSFSVKKGETLGIIGENGAGKSTLLKVLSGVLTPTSGKVEVHGRVLSILELGIGFHPEFTGRENIFFYGDILGFSRDFIRSRIDEIIDFSELGSFIDIPIKTYSSGMLMRLAFSIVTSFDPDILIIDEALSVGDIHFQEKSINRIMQFKMQGKTLIFCSHSSYHVNILCNKVIWLRDGKIEMEGDSQRILPAYEYYELQKGTSDKLVSHEETKSPIIIKEIKLLNELPLRRGDDMKVALLVESNRDDVSYHVALSIKIDSSRGIFFTGTNLCGITPPHGRMNKIVVTFPKISLLGGFYYFHVRVLDRNAFVLIHEKISPPFEVLKDSSEMGVCYMENQWEIMEMNEA